jgi:hypothetical protein
MLSSIWVCYTLQLVLCGCALTAAGPAKPAKRQALTQSPPGKRNELQNPRASKNQKATANAVQNFNSAGFLLFAAFFGQKEDAQYDEKYRPTAHARYKTDIAREEQQTYY